MQGRFAIENRLARQHAGERGFKITTPLSVEGPDSDGSYFIEETKLYYINHMVAAFPLMNSVSLESRLKISLPLPPKLSLGKDMRLMIKGTIIFIDFQKERTSPPRITLRLENRYVIEQVVSQLNANAPQQV